MKTVLITGGAGFLGSNLCQKQIDLGNKVICLDNFYTGKLRNIENLLRNKQFKLVDADVEQKITIDDEIDEIYNLACPASPPSYQKSPTKTIRTNVLGMINMLELANTKNAKILQASTSEIYGEPLVHPQTESYRGNVNPIGIRACYDEGKRCAETLCFDYNREFGTKVKIVRIFNTYGPNMDPEDGRVVSNFILQALKNEDITVYGKGIQTRSFCYVDDLIEGFIKMMGTEVGFYGPLNLGNPEEFNVLQLAEKIIKMTESKSRIIHLELPEDDPTQRRPDIKYAKDRLGWEPTIKLEEGLKRTIKYYKELT